MAERTKHPITTGDESHERDLNRHRTAERRDVEAEALAHLRNRGILLDEDESPDRVVEVLEAVEAFERAVEARGGDLMVDTPPVREPDNPLFVLPRLQADESLPDYVRRIQQATGRLKASRAG